MTEFRVGDIFKVQCNVQPGAFPDEKLITIHAEGEEISGFIKSRYLRLENENDDEGYILGKVIGVSGETLHIQVPGSYFTSAAGKTSISKEWAGDNLEPIPAT